MSLTETQSLRVVVYEGEGSQPLSNESRFDTMSTLLENGFAVTRTNGRQAVAPNDRTSLLFLGRFNPGEVPSFGGGGSSSEVAVSNIEDKDPEAITDLVRTQRESLEAFDHGQWKPWFPVIDYDRCTNCMQCLSFCLFGVYGVDDDNKLQVQNNDSCKTNCPACSRVCPEAAIMFPKYRTGPINGDRVSSSDLKREKMKIDISSLLGGDVYQMLRDRSEKAKSRFSKERNPDKALNERKKCLTKLAQSGDIPEEVLMSLPAPDEIQRRAEEAAAKADAARAANKQS
jgi:Pyruvate/2-oxoacid:ferredoxin oxidoreductase delta subunit